MMETYNPASGDLIKKFDEMSPKEIEVKIAQALDSYEKWRYLNLKERLSFISEVSRRLQQSKDQFVDLMMLEIGKPKSQALAEVEKCISLCQYYVDNAESFLQDEKIKSDHENSFVTFQPLGVVLSIMPWNFPLWQVFRFIVPSLIVGNVSLLKHATNVSQISVDLEDLFSIDGYPKKLFQSLLMSGKKANELISHRDIQAVTFTGSTNVGKEIAKTAGQNLKKAVLELGGSDPYVVLADADLKLAAQKCMKSRLINSGQSCIAAKRFIVEKSVENDFISYLEQEIKSYDVGQPNEAKVGPLAKENFVKDLEEQYQDAIKQGAQLVFESSIPNQGFFAPVRLIKNCTSEMKVFKEETFGPLACVFSAANEYDAIRLANQSPFGLGAAIFSKDKNRAETIAKTQIQSGTVAINDFVKSDPRLPFGGIKESGIGRELSHYGLKEFVNIKTITVD